MDAGMYSIWAMHSTQTVWRWLIEYCSEQDHQDRAFKTKQQLRTNLLKVNWSIAAEERHP